jgi:hypothetical protein
MAILRASTACPSGVLGNRPAHHPSAPDIEDHPEVQRALVAFVAKL